MKDINKKKILQALKVAIDTEIFVKATLSAYIGTDAELQKIIARPVIIKGDNFLSFTYRYKSRDIVKNHTIYEAKKMIGDMLGKAFNSMQLFTTKSDTVLHIIGKSKSRLKELPASTTEKPTMQHDKQKQRFIEANSLFLKELEISNSAGEIRTEKYDKYRQIDKFIEIVDGLFGSSSLAKKKQLRIFDLGSGKSYLTFALYSYFAQHKKKAVEMTGVEVRPELVAGSVKLAETCEFTGLKFVEGEIKKTAVRNADIVVALHACDTATDDAIVKGIRSEAEIIVLAPCCHKYVRKQMHPEGAIADLLREGILLQRESDLVTDSLRALVLELFGYKTQVFEFISSEHTSKNVMITAVKQGVKSDLDEEVLAQKVETLRKIKEIKQLFGISNFYLDKELNLFKE